MDDVMVDVEIQDILLWANRTSPTLPYESQQYECAREYVENLRIAIDHLNDIIPRVQKELSVLKRITAAALDEMHPAYIAGRESKWQVVLTKQQHYCALLLERMFGREKTLREAYEKALVAVANHSSAS